MSKPRAKMKTNSSTLIHRSIRNFNTPARATHRHLTVVRAGGGGEFEPPGSSILKEIHVLSFNVEVFKRSRVHFRERMAMSSRSRIKPAWQTHQLPLSQTAKAWAELESHMPSIPPKLRKEASNVRSNLFSLCVRSLRAEWNLYINIKLCFLPATSVATRIGISCFLNELMTLSLSNWSISPCNNTTEKREAKSNINYISYL